MIARSDQTPKILPFLKWPGGKRWLVPHITQTLRAELRHTYIEPCCGAAAVFLGVSPRSAILADVDAELIRCLGTVRKYPLRVLRALWRWSNSAECFYRVREMMPRTKLMAAARFIYLNRTCWGGIHRRNHDGRFNVPFGNSGRVICRKESFLANARALGCATLQTSDFSDTVRKADDGDVVYADPPYTTRGEDNGFLRYNEKLFSWADQERLAASAIAAARRGAFVAVSGLRHKELLALYRGWWAVEIPRHCLVSREVEARGPVTEVLILSRKPKVPPCAGEVRLARI